MQQNFCRSSLWSKILLTGEVSYPQWLQWFPSRPFPSYRLHSERTIKSPMLETLGTLQHMKSKGPSNWLWATGRCVWYGQPQSQLEYFVDIPQCLCDKLRGRRKLFLSCGQKGAPRAAYKRGGHTMPFMWPCIFRKFSSWWQRCCSQEDVAAVLQKHW